MGVAVPERERGCREGVKHEQGVLHRVNDREFFVLKRESRREASPSTD